jgi:4-aminobutyrate aminotransferase-like enzyme/Ser/Thr protein kinase RdoA (MazF antagonist)/murein DD-endopeptidase MepM/ murein hydrolase activator NlpD
VARERFGIEAAATALPSERDQNVALTATDGRRYVLKVANAGERREVLDAEDLVLARLASTGLLPRLVAALDGSEIVEHSGHLVRLVTFLDGVVLARARRVSDALRRDLGRAVATIDLALASIDHPALHRDFHWDLARGADVVARLGPRLAAGPIAAAVEQLGRVHAEHVAPRLGRLPQSVIHNDANDYNVLVDERAQRVTGIVDLGDMVFSHTVNDLAIAMAYTALGGDDPLAAAAAVAAGYHAVRPLSADELAVLFGLTAMRLCVSACLAGEQQAARPDDDYLAISQGPIARVLPALAAVHPRYAHYVLRDACGLAPVPHAPAIVAWLGRHRERIAPVTGFALDSVVLAPIDLSVGSALVASDTRANEPGPLGARIAERMTAAGAAVGVGGYDEARVIYAEPVCAEQLGTEQRTVHIAIDLTLPAGSPVHAPLAGVVHGFEDAATRHDYGPVVVLRHSLAGAGPDGESLDLFTLYGHLARGSLDALRIGQLVEAGQRFAEVGAPPDNGDWWPHLHFQLVTDLLDVPCNVNGVAPASRRAVWLSLSPDPNLILGIPASALPRHRSTEAIAATRRARSGANVSVSYGSEPLNVARGWMQYLFDETGRPYLDAYNNVPHVGHSHPRVVRAVADQLAVLNTNTRYLQEQWARYADALAEQFPDPLGVCFFTASGSEANELALRLARAHTGARDLLVLDSAYHGHTTTLIDISPYKHGGPGGSGRPGWVHTTPVPDIYRGAHRGDDAGARYAAELTSVLDRVTGSGRRIAGYIAETCPSVGGQIVLPSGYLDAVYTSVRGSGGVCIADEVQTGFGRIGSHFWAFEQHDVVPDIVVLGKPIANGYPMGAVITTAAIAASFANGMEFFSTFGGSTAACVAGLTTLEVTLEDGLQAHAAAVGSHLLDRLRGLAAKHDLIGDVRGSGLFLGVELVRDRTTLAPATEEADRVVVRMRELGVLAGTDGPHHNVIKVRGPMPFTAADADLLVAVLDRALAEL